MCAHALETAILNDIASRAQNRGEFTQDYIDNIHKSYDEIIKTYAKLDEESRTNLKTRRNIALNAMSATNILIHQGPKRQDIEPQSITADISDARRKKSTEQHTIKLTPEAQQNILNFVWTNAKNKLLEAYVMPIWETTIEKGKTNPKILNAHTSEYNVITDLVGRMHDKSKLDSNSYGVTISLLNNIHQLYLYDAEARQEFLERQKCLHPALECLYPEHKAANLYGAEKTPREKPQLTAFGKSVLPPAEQPRSPKLTLVESSPKPPLNNEP